MRPEPFPCLLAICLNIASQLHGILAGANVVSKVFCTSAASRKLQVNNALSMTSQMQLSISESTVNWEGYCLNLFMIKL